MNYIIFDLEATCWKGPPEPDNEIIEIGAVSYNAKGEKRGEFNEFVKPKLNPTLSWFCKELTSIPQEEIDVSASFPEVLSRFQNWIGIEKPYLLCSWGHYDRKQLTKDCLLHNLSLEWLHHHISLKHQYTEIVGVKKHHGMSRALKREGIPLEGTHHRGIDDARNIAKIFLAHLGKWGAEST